VEKPALEFFTNVTFMKREEEEGAWHPGRQACEALCTGWIFPGLAFFHPASTVCTNTLGDLLRCNSNTRIYNWY